MVKPADDAPEPQPVNDDGSPIMPPNDSAGHLPTATDDGDVPVDSSGNPSGQPDNLPVDAEVPDAPQNIGYCVNPDCQIHSMELWHPVTTDIPEQPDGAMPHNCSDLDHPHPVMCQCGQLLHAEPADADSHA